MPRSSQNGTRRQAANGSSSNSILHGAKHLVLTHVFFCLFNVHVQPGFIQVRLDVFQGQLGMQVCVYNEGKQNELIGDGVLLLNEVIDKGELDGTDTRSMQ